MLTLRRGIALLIPAIGLTSCGTDPDGPTPGTLAISIQAHDFGDVEVGQSTDPYELSITNSTPRRSARLTTRLTGSTAQFRIDRDGCAGESLDSGASCQLTLSMQPGTGGPAQVAVVVSEPGGISASATLRGNGIVRRIAFTNPLGGNLGQEGVGGAGPPRILVLENYGSVVSGPLSVVLTGQDSTEFQLSSDGCSRQYLAPQHSCSLQLRFKPHSTGSKTADVVVTGGARELAEADLTGESRMSVTLSASPSLLDFGYEVSGTRTLLDVTIQNTGADATGALRETVSNAAAPGFAADLDGCTGHQLEPGESCVVRMAFAPAQGVTYTGTLEVEDGFGSRSSVEIRGTADVASTLRFAPDQLTFPTVMAGLEASPAQLTVTNSGTTATPALTARILHCVDDCWVGSPDFRISDDACTGKQLAPGASCTMGIVFAPVDPGGKAAVLTVTPNTEVGAPILGAATGLNIELPGIGGVGQTFDFGSHGVGTTSDVTMAVTNSGTAPTGLIGLTLSSGAFVALDGPQACANRQLDPGATCMLYLRFAPQASGSYSGSVSAEANPGGTGLFYVRGSAF